MMRDGRDVALSVMGRYFGAKNIFTAAREWQQCVRANDEFLGRFPADQVHRIRYEDFLTNPVAEFERLIPFLGVEDSAGQLMSHIKDELPAKLNQANFDKWRKRWNEAQRRSFERIACNELKQHGYETLVDEPAAEPGLPQKVFWYCDNKARKWTYAGYWKDNLYKAGLRSRQTVQAIRSFFLRAPE